MSDAILWPTILLVLPVLAAFTGIGVAAIRRPRVRRDGLSPGAGASAFPEPAQAAGDMPSTLLAIPMLYLVLVPLLLVTGYATPLQAGLAWGFVLLRGLHGILHMLFDDVRRCATVSIASTLVLFAMWAGFATDLASIRGC